MAFTHQIQYTWNRNSGGETITQLSSESADSEDNRDITVPDATTDMQVDLAFVRARLKSLFILSDQAILLQTNDPMTPIDTIALAANVPLVWSASSGAANPFVNGDVTAVYLTNASGATATVKIRILKDGTP